MTSFLAALLGRFVEFFFGRLIGAVGDYFTAKRKQREIDTEARNSIEALKKAQTSKEIDDATKSALDGF